MKKLLLILLTACLFSSCVFAATTVGYYKTSITTSILRVSYRDSLMTLLAGKDFYPYGCTAALQNSAKRDSLGKFIKRYRTAYPSAKVVCIIATDTSIYGILHDIKTYADGHDSLSQFTGYNLEWEYWRSTAGITFSQWIARLHLMKQRLTNVEVYIGYVKVAAEIDSMVRYCYRILPANYADSTYNSYTKLFKWFKVNDRDRMVNIAKACTRQGKTIQAFPIFNNKSAYEGGYITAAGEANIFKCWTAAYNSRNVPGRSKIDANGYVIYVK